MDPTEWSPREPGWLLAESLQNTKVLDSRPGFGSQEFLEGRSSSCEMRSQSSQQEKSTSQPSQHEKRSQSSQHEKRSSQSSQQEKMLAFELLGSQEFNLSQMSTASQPDNTEVDIPLPTLFDTNTQSDVSDPSQPADENGNKGKGCPINISEMIKSLAPVPIAELPKENIKVKAKKSKGVPAEREKNSAKNDKIPKSIENSNKKKIPKNDKKSASKTRVPQQLPKKKPTVEKAPIDGTKTDLAKKKDNTLTPVFFTAPTQSVDITSQESFCIANIIDDILT